MGGQGSGRLTSKQPKGYHSIYCTDYAWRILKIRAKDKGLPISEYLELLIRSNDSIPYELVLFELINLIEHLKIYPYDQADVVDSLRLILEKMDVSPNLIP